MKVRLDHVYLSVKNMSRAVKFYENVLSCKVNHREDDTWADFDIGKGVYLGLINPKIISNKRVCGNNSVIVFWTDDVDLIFSKVKKLGIKIIHKPIDLDFTDYPYRCFQCYDTENNLLEFAKYEK